MINEPKREKSINLVRQLFIKFSWACVATSPKSINNMTGWKGRSSNYPNQCRLRLTTTWFVQLSLRPETTKIVKATQFIMMNILEPQFISAVVFLNSESLISHIEKTSGHMLESAENNVTYIFLVMIWSCIQDLFTTPRDRTGYNIPAGHSVRV